MPDLKVPAKAIGVTDVEAEALARAAYDLRDRPEMAYGLVLLLARLVDESDGGICGDALRALGWMVAP